MKPHAERLAGALADPNVREGLLAFQRSWRVDRDDRIAELEDRTGQDFDELRGDLADTKRQAREDIDELLGRFGERAAATGTQVHRAADAAEANRLIAGIVDAATPDGRRPVVVKTKSMLTEEIGLNQALEHAGATVLETDLGEWLLQLAGEHPSHLVLPAIHKRATQIAALLEDVLGRPFDPDDVETMVEVVRTELREPFLEAAVGVTGANAVVAKTGAVLLVTNEGNAPLTFGLPSTRIVVAGLEKVVATTADALDTVRLLGRSATGQPITTYTQFLAGPLPGQEVHVVLVDNGRSALADDPALADALACIRCAACSNVCPPYQVVGGHGFGHVYTGAIGLVVTPAHHGLEAIAGPQELCVSCGACTEVCPADIPLADQILEVRRRVVERDGLPRSQRAMLRALRSRRATRALAAVGATLAMPLSRDSLVRTPARGRHLSWRTPPAPARRPAHRRLADRVGAGGDVDLFVQCVTDHFLPEVAEATVAVLERAGTTVSLPPDQHCCGLPAFDTGDHATARVMAKQTIEALEGDRPVVTPAPSCAVMVGHYPELLADEPAWRARAEQLADRFVDLVGWLSDNEGASPAPASVEACTTLTFCQTRTVLHRPDALDAVVTDGGGVVCPQPEPDVCCGFGGSTSLTNPEVARRIADRKLDGLVSTGVETVVVDNPGCLLHLRGAADRRGDRIQIRHVAEVLTPRDRGMSP